MLSFWELKYLNKNIYFGQLKEAIKHLYHKAGSRHNKINKLFTFKLKLAIKHVNILQIKGVEFYYTECVHNIQIISLKKINYLNLMTFSLLIMNWFDTVNILEYNYLNKKNY